MEIKIHGLPQPQPQLLANAPFVERPASRGKRCYPSLSVMSVIEGQRSHTRLYVHRNLVMSQEKVDEILKDIEQTESVQTTVKFSRKTEEEDKAAADFDELQNDPEPVKTPEPLAEIHLAECREWYQNYLLSINKKENPKDLEAEDKAVADEYEFLVDTNPVMTSELTSELEEEELRDSTLENNMNFTAEDKSTGDNEKIQVHIDPDIKSKQYSDIEIAEWRDWYQDYLISKDKEENYTSLEAEDKAAADEDEFQVDQNPVMTIKQVYEIEETELRDSRLENKSLIVDYKTATDTSKFQVYRDTIMISPQCSEVDEDEEWFQHSPNLETSMEENYNSLESEDMIVSDNEEFEDDRNSIMTPAQLADIFNEMTLDERVPNTPMVLKDEEVKNKRFGNEAKAAVDKDELTVEEEIGVTATDSISPRQSESRYRINPMVEKKVLAPAKLKVDVDLIFATNCLKWILQIKESRLRNISAESTDTDLPRNSSLANRLN